MAILVHSRSLLSETPREAARLACAQDLEGEIDLTPGRERFTLVRPVPRPALPREPFDPHHDHPPYVTYGPPQSAG